MIASPSKSVIASSSGPGYSPILDGLRFIVAFWVAVGHFEMTPLFGDYNAGVGFWHSVRHAWSTIVFGTPAVIVFFIISGFCIHLPFRGTGEIDIGRTISAAIPASSFLLSERWQSIAFWASR